MESVQNLTKTFGRDLYRFVKIRKNRVKIMGLGFVSIFKTRSMDIDTRLETKLKDIETAPPKKSLVSTNFTDKNILRNSTKTLNDHITD